MCPQHLNRGRHVVGCVSNWRLGLAKVGGREEGSGGATGTGGPFTSSQAISPCHSNCPRNRPRWTKGSTQQGVHDVLQRKKCTLLNGPHTSEHGDTRGELCD